MARDFFTMDDFDLDSKTVFLRIDINSPILPETGELLDDTRIQLHLPTLRRLKNSKVVIFAHQSRPGKKDFVPLKIHARRLEYYLKRPVKYIDSFLGSAVIRAIEEMREGDIILLENTRFSSEEVVIKNFNGTDFKEQANTYFIKTLANYGDYFVNDAFSVSHRSQPSVVGFVEHMPSMAGELMKKELSVLGDALKKGKRPLLVYLGGAKADDSIAIAENMLENGIATKVLTGGVVANIFLVAKGYDIGEPSFSFINKKIPEHEKVLKRAEVLLKNYQDKIAVPVDVAINVSDKRKDIPVEELPQNYPIHDIGINTIADYSRELASASTIIANGPAGVFELKNFAFGTKAIFKAIANSKGFSIVGGGETTSVLNELGLHNKINHISSGGGACITFLSNGDMPGRDALVRSKQLYEKGYYQHIKS